MADNTVTQKVAAILAADAVGYTRLMAEDEPATIQALDAARAVFAEHIEANQGRVVDTAGDSVLAVFATTAGAVHAGVAIQASLAEANQPVPEDRRMHFRIGIHLGDIFEKTDGTIYGDGVNVAARLESIAQPGAIIVSNVVQAALRDRLDVDFADAGSHQVKNVKHPVKAFSVVLGGSDGDRMTKSSRRPKLVIALAAGLAILVGLAVWGLTIRVEAPQMVQADGTPTDDPVLAVPMGPVIAVLPFHNLSGNPDQDYFSDGLTEDLITGLSRFRDLFVIGRNTSFQYKGRVEDVRTIAAEIGARYVTVGSVRRSGETVRVSAQLIDATDGTQLWNDSFDRDLTATDLFALQDEITAEIVGAIAGSYGVISRAGLEDKPPGTEKLEAYDCVLRAYAYEQILTPEVHAETRDCLERAVDLDPSYADAWSKLAFIYADEYAFAYNTRPDALDRALAAAQKGVELDPSSQMTHWHLARTHFWRNEVNEAIVEADRALAINPNNAFVLAAAGVYMAPTSPESLKRGVALTDKAMRIDPNPPGWYHVANILDRYANRDYEAARVESLKMNLPGFFWTHVWRLAIYGQLERPEEADETMTKLLALYPSFAENSRVELEKFNMHPTLAEHVVEGWKKAGLFDEPPPPTRPVIAVLPLDNMSGDPEQDYFADGITEDLITELSRFEGLLVIARNSTFRFKGEAVDIAEVAEALGADYVLEGGVRKFGNKVRITAQLIDAETGTHLWAERYDRELIDVFEVQDDVTPQIISAMQSEISELTPTRGSGQLTESHQAYDLFLRARIEKERRTEAAALRARDLLQQAIELDPAFAAAYAELSDTQHLANYYGWDIPDATLDAAMLNAEKAVALDGSLPLAHAQLGRRQYEAEQFSESASSLNTAIALDTNYAMGYMALAALYTYTGDYALVD